jgi:cysteine desulfurase
MFWKKRIYLDYAAGPRGNPSSVHEEGRRAKRRLEDARLAVARLAEVKADDVVFTSGATEANAIAIHGVVNSRQAIGDRRPHILYLPSAHASIVENAKMLAQRGVEIEPLPIANGRVDIDALKKLIRPETALVTMEAVCGETGTIWNTREVANALRSSRVLGEMLNRPSGLSASSRGRGDAATPIYLHVDASQAVMTEKISRTHFAADLLTLDGGKVGAPGAGALIAHRTIALAPLYGGGGQERGLRSGTENVEAIEKFAAALAKAHSQHDRFAARAAALRAQLVESLKTIPDLYINEGREVAPHILNISLLGRDTDYLVALLDDAGFALSTKSACESLSGEGSRAVLALTGEAARAASTLRISLGPASSARDLARFAKALRAAIHFIDRGASR